MAQSKRSNRVDVFRLKTFDRRNGTPHGRAIYEQILRITKPEAGIIVHRGYAVWRGEKKRAITILIPVNALLLFVGAMRFRGNPEARAIDSKTHQKLPGTRGYAHVRSREAYSPVARVLTEDPLCEEIFEDYRAEQRA